MVKRLNWQSIARAAFAALILHLVLIQPNHPAALSWKTPLLFPLELPVILFALMAIGTSRFSRPFRLVIVTVIVLIGSLKAADFVMFMALNRGFNPVADLPLVGSLYDLIVGAFGPLSAGGAVVGSLLMLILVVLALWWATGIWSRLPLPRLMRIGAGTAAVCAAALMVVDIGYRMGAWQQTAGVGGTAFTARVGVERVGMARQTLADLRAFRAAAREDTLSGRTGLFDLVDRDLIVVFVESYGRTSLDTPFYADLHRETLQKAQTDLESRGLSLASTLLTSPTQGGQSWLAHASFANGLWVTDQTSYGAVLSSGRQTLYHLAANSGFHTAAVMPQITLDWPEAQFMGFDTILAAKDLGYRGKPLNWVTMPDQFTFAAMDRLLRGADRSQKPLFIQMALGSSHAPWVPVPEVVAWETLGDGSIFDPLVDASDPPSVVWKDHDRVRAQYRLAVDYALQTVFAYAALHAEDPPLMIVVGDHQAAGFVALDERPHVPMHLIGPAHLVELLSDDRFVPGLIPAPNETPPRMDQMRSYLVDALSTAKLARDGS